VRGSSVRRSIGELQRVQARAASSPGRADGDSPLSMRTGKRQIARRFRYLQNIRRGVRGPSSSNGTSSELRNGFTGPRPGSKSGPPPDCPIGGSGGPLPHIIWPPTRRVYIPPAGGVSPP